MAKVIAELNRPALISRTQDPRRAALHEVQTVLPATPSSTSSPNYDYYQPEAYIPPATLLEKEAHHQRSSTSSASPPRAPLRAPRRIIVSSVSCIYGLGCPKPTTPCSLLLEKDRRSSVKTSRAARQILYERNDSTSVAAPSASVEMSSKSPYYDENAFRISSSSARDRLPLADRSPLRTVREKYFPVCHLSKSHTSFSPSASLRY